MIRGIKYIRLHTGTTCPWPVTDRAQDDSRLHALLGRFSDRVIHHGATT